METPSVLLDETFSNFIALLFPDLSAEHLAAVRSVSKALQLRPDQVVVREGEEGDSLFILTRGRLEARGTFEGREITLGTFSPGDILGEVAFLNKVPRTATVRALEPSVVIELQGELTRRQLAAYPGLLNQLEEILQQRVLKTLALLKKAGKKPDGNP
jgi:CRP-like cAMP-binding protein